MRFRRASYIVFVDDGSTDAHLGADRASLRRAS